ncbi:MAG TPA: hypothetical protein G4N98_04370 [Thermoflexia bacterium]|nr:hypothetical protein [Thermoflexia bacterium]
MDISFEEGQLHFQFKNVQAGAKFDEQPPGSPDHNFLAGRGLKPVDFIIETADRVLFIEIKDPEHTRAKRQAVAEFKKKVQGVVLRDELVRKCRDTYLYRTCTHNLPRKDIHYYVLITGLNVQDLSTLTKQLLDQLPVLLERDAELRNLRQHGQQWDNFVTASVAFNLRTWQAQFPDFLVERRAAE